MNPRSIASGPSLRFFNVRPALLFAALILPLPWCTQASRADERLPEGRSVVRLEVQPGAIHFSHRFVSAQLVVSGELDTGELLDVTRMVRFEAPEQVIRVSPTGLVVPVADGQGVLKATLGEQSLELPVEVSGQSNTYQASFVRDIMPTLSKLGCNAGTCHGAAQGKNGFQLSLRGYDPLYDHRALTDDLAGRRFNRAAPEKSLMLLKPSGSVPHVGGVVMRPGERAYELLRAWIADGVKLDLDSPRVARIEVFPQNARVPLPEMKQQVAVRATYTDGSIRDVTAEAFVESSNTEIVTVDKAALVTAVRRGEAAILARYEGAYAATTIIVMGDRSGFAWQDAPENNFLDTLVHEKLMRVKILPSGACTDAEFIRRVYLDLTGLPPAPDEVRAFLSDGRDTRPKRDELVDRLVGSDAYVEHWTQKWADLLQVNRNFLTEKGAWALRNWIRQSVASNMPYDQFVHSILTSRGSTYENPPASYLRVLREPEAAMENSTQLFLGVRFNCNKCHDHPFERWTQDQYYHLAAFFAQVGRKPGASAGDEIVYDTPGAGEVTHIRTGQIAAPSFPYTHADMSVEEANRSEQFAHWVTSKDNPYFAKSYVNRQWAYLTGAGLIEPIDDIRAGNPPSNPELLDRLTQEFVTSGFDVQHLVRTICKSQVYQRSLETNQWNEDDAINYSHALARRLPAETLYDTLQKATGAEAKLPGVPSGFLAAQLPDSSVKLPGDFLDLFGRPPRESACECERTSGMALGQALSLVNGPTIADAIAAPNNRIARLVAAEADDARVVDELFISILCRPPSQTELATGLATLREAEDRLGGAQDLAWALINSPAFLFNR